MENQNERTEQEKPAEVEASAVSGLVMLTDISVTDPEQLRNLADDPNFESAELYQGEDSGHKFKPGDVTTLTGLEDFPEYNGTPVKITSIREDGAHGKAYYVDGPVNAVLNWTYEYRLA